MDNDPAFDFSDYLDGSTTHPIKPRGGTSTMAKPKRLNDRQLSLIMGPRNLSPRQLLVLQTRAQHKTEWQAYRWLCDHDPSWTASVIPRFSRKRIYYNLSFINFRQHLANAYGRLHVHNLKDALASPIYLGQINN